MWIGFNYFVVDMLIDVVNLFLFEFMNLIGEIINFIELDEDEMVYVVCFVLIKFVLIYMLIGSCILMYCIGSGCVFLSVLLLVDVCVWFDDMVCILYMLCMVMVFDEFVVLFDSVWCEGYVIN